MGENSRKVTGPGTAERRGGVEPGADLRCWWKEQLNSNDVRGRGSNMRAKTALRGPCWCQETCCPTCGRLCLAILGAGRTAGQADAAASSLRTVEGELEAAGRGDLGRFCQELGGEKEDKTPCCPRRIPLFGMAVPTVSFGRDVVMTRGAEAGRLLATCLREEESRKGHVGILGPLRSGSC